MANTNVTPQANTNVTPQANTNVTQANQEKTKAPINISFQGEITLIGEGIGMQVQKIDDTMIYLIAPLSKTPSDGIGLNEAINSIASSVAWFDDAFDLDTKDIEESIRKVAKDALKDIRLYLKMAYLYRKEAKGQEPVMEFAFGIGVNFTGDNADSAKKEEENKTAFAINNLSFCIWSFNANPDEASKARRKIIEKRMGIVDLSSDDQIFSHISTEEINLLESTPVSGDTAKIEADKKTAKDTNTKDKADGKPAKDTNQKADGKPAKDANQKGETGEKLTKE